MKRLFLFSLLAVAPVAANAQQSEPDSLKTKELDEVVVEAIMQRTSPVASVYNPTSRQKAASQNAIDLLRLMAIPQIRINPVSDAITDNAGEEVAIFINSLPASEEEMEGLRTADVKRVEYLEFPTDPRFRDARRVVNFILQEYAYGGYTKLTANENFLVGLSSRVNVFSKFSYKNLTYDLYAGVNNWDAHHIGNSARGVYSLKNSDGRDYTLVRNETLEGSHFRQNQIPVTFRATYASDKIQIRNIVAYSFLDIPAYSQHGALTYQPGAPAESVGIADQSGTLSHAQSGASDYTFSRANPSRTDFFIYQGSFFFTLPKGFSLDLTPRFNYSHSDDRLSYQASNAPEIIRNARENVYNYKVDAFLQKRFGQKHTAMLGFNGGDNINRLRYSGSSSYSDRFHNAFTAGMLSYSFRTEKVSLSADAGVCWEMSDINGQTNNDTYPFTHINIRYSPDYRNSFSAYFQFASNTPGINQKASDILQDNEFMYVSGNPLLENSRHITLNIAYTWMPSNYFGLSAFNNFMEYFDRQLTVYEPYNNGKALIRNYRNNGNSFKEEIGLAANWKLADGKLQLYASPKQTFYKSTGIYNKTYNPFSVTLQATCYLNNFYIQAYYQSADRQMFAISPQIFRNRNSHSLTAGWANSDWNIRLTAFNFFNKGWDNADTVTEAPLYSEYKETIGTSSHPRLNVTATYTFGYGKKIQRGNEVGEQSGSTSAIMK